MFYSAKLDRIAFQRLLSFRFSDVDYDVYYDFCIIAKRLYPNISDSAIDDIWIMAREEVNAIVSQLIN